MYCYNVLYSFFLIKKEKLNKITNIHSNSALVSAKQPLEKTSSIIASSSAFCYIMKTIEELSFCMNVTTLMVHVRHPKGDQRQSGHTETTDLLNTPLLISGRGVKFRPKLIVYKH